MSETQNENYGTVRISEIKNFLRKVEKLPEAKAVPDYPVPAQLVINSLFPNLWENFLNNIKQQYTLGYIQGRKEALGEEDNEVNHNS